jgi:hypothetical protein
VLDLGGGSGPSPTPRSVSRRFGCGLDLNDAGRVATHYQLKVYILSRTFTIGAAKTCDLGGTMDAGAFSDKSVPRRFSTASPTKPAARQSAYRNGYIDWDALSPENQTR